MTMTVKKLIAELEKIDNKLLEVEIETYDLPTIIPSVRDVTKAKGKVIIRPDMEYLK